MLMIKQQDLSAQKQKQKINPIKSKKPKHTNNNKANSNNTKNNTNKITELNLFSKMKHNQYQLYIQNFNQRSLSVIQSVNMQKTKKLKQWSNISNISNRQAKRSQRQRYNTQPSGSVLQKLPQKTKLQSQLQLQLQLQRQLSPQKMLLHSEVLQKQEQDNGIFCMNSKKRIELQPLNKQKNPIYNLDKYNKKSNNSKAEQFGIRFLSVKKSKQSKMQIQSQNNANNSNSDNNSQSKKLKLKLSNLSTDRKSSSILKQLQLRNCIQQKQKSPHLIQRIRQRIQKCKLAELQQKQSYELSTNYNMNKIMQIVNHFKKIWNLFEGIQKKQNSSKLIDYVREYILQQNSDASDLEELYKNGTVKKQIKKIVFYQQVCMIILIQLIIYNKLHTCSNYSYIRTIMHDILDFYFSIQSDLQSIKLFQNNQNQETDIRNHHNRNKANNVNHQKLRFDRQKQQGSMSKFVQIYQKIYKNQKNIQRVQGIQGLKSLQNLNNKKKLQLKNYNYNENNDQTEQSNPTQIQKTPQFKIIKRPRQILNSITQNISKLFKHAKHLQKFVQSQFQLFQRHNNNLLYYNLLQYFSYSLLGKDWSQWQIQFLQTCPSPYLHFQSSKKYTLVLDLDETLVHYKMINQYKGQFLLRPYLFQFLQQLSEYFQLGIFTCSLPQYADLILDHMKQIQFRLYRHHTIRINDQYVKDLSRIGRDLRKVILVDNIDHNFRLQKMNGIHIKSWYGDRKDEMLMKLSKELIKLVESGAQDVSISNHRRVFL